MRWEVPFSCGVVCSKLLYVLTVSGANNSEWYSTLEIVTVPCTNQALLDWLALLLPPHCVCASTVQLAVQRSGSSRLPLSRSA